MALDTTALSGNIPTTATGEPLPDEVVRHIVASQDVTETQDVTINGVTFVSALSFDSSTNKRDLSARNEEAIYKRFGYIIPSDKRVMVSSSIDAVTLENLRASRDLRLTLQDLEDE